MHENRGRKLDPVIQSQIRRLAKHEPIKRIARITGTSKNTVKKYAKA